MIAKRTPFALLVGLLLIALGAGCPPRQSATTGPRARPAPDHLKGDWQLTSTLKVRQGVGQPTQLMLAVSRQIQDILDGKVQIPGIPAALTALMGPFVSKYIKQVVPSWAGDLVKRLTAVDAALGGLEVESIETLRPQGGHRYSGSSRWLRVTVRSGSMKVTGSGREVPGLGQLQSMTYVASEHTGYLRIRDLKVTQQLGPLVRWAAEALLGAVTCATKHIPCFRKLEEAVSALVPCDKLAGLVAKAAPALRNMAPLVQAGCESQKARLIKELGLRLDKLSLPLTFLKLEGDSRIDGDRFVGGRWRGTMGKAYGGGSFKGSFSGRRAGQ